MGATGTEGTFVHMGVPLDMRYWLVKVSAGGGSKVSVQLRLPEAFGVGLST